ncbi:putative lipid II flippase FtsW [Gordonia aichiensis]|uniref:Probable peptidoglycan glycosyltransferase FtsW n=1 Tax=Gordonia aichiensis NBRC 108223 TaxID=1220583 RepID=L7KMG4_9ACTN|nr:cell division protein FtsW [Gordonia aichiensis NBRC 108223]
MTTTDATRAGAPESSGPATGATKTGADKAAEKKTSKAESAKPSIRSGRRVLGGGSSGTRSDLAAVPATIVEGIRNLLSRPLASYHLILTMAALMTSFGLIMVLSASSVEGYSADGSAYGLFANQVIFVVLGAIVFYLTLRMPVRFFRRMAVPMIAVTTVMLGLVLVPGIGTLSQGARRWFDINGLSVQPSELVKVALCVWGAHLLASRRRDNASLRELLVPLVPVGLLICLLIILEPNLSTTITIAIIVGALLWFAGLPIKVFVTFVLTGVGIAVVLALVESYRSQRVMSFLGGIDDPQGAGYQARQATFALANGGVFGVGLGQSRAKWNYLPNAHNDFIFAIIGEELGLIGGLLVVFLFVVLAFTGFRIAHRCTDPFLRLMTSTITVLITAQAFINIGYVIGLLPVTGIQLPLLSAGGTSTLTVLAMLGLLANAARHEPEAVAALTTGQRSRVSRWFRLPIPVAYTPSRAESARDRLDARGRRPPAVSGTRRSTPQRRVPAWRRAIGVRFFGVAPEPSPAPVDRRGAPRSGAVRVDYRVGYSGRGERRGGAPGRTTRSAGTARAGQPERRATSRAASGSVRTGSGRYSGHPGRADKMSGGPRRSGNGR